MKGKIRTQQRCPDCGQALAFDERLGFWCEAHHFVADRYFIDVYSRKRMRIFSDRTGYPLDSYLRAKLLLEEIHYEIQQKTFDRTRYVKLEAKSLWTSKLLDRFMKEKEKTIAPSYRSNYHAMVDAAKNHFGAMDVREIRRIHVSEYRDSLQVQGKSGKTVWNYLTNFRSFLNWCRTDLRCLQIVDPLPKVAKEEPRVSWLSKKDQTALFSNVPEADRELMRFLFLCGVRPGEARALRCKDVDLTLGVIRISATWSLDEIRNRRKGGGAPLELPIHSEMLQYITERVRGCLPEAWLFPNPRTGEAYSVQALRKVWAKVKEAAGITGLRLYDASRHSVGSQLGAAGEDIQQISNVLGHSSLRTTQKYTHPDLEAKRKALEKMSLKKVVAIGQWAGSGEDTSKETQETNKKSVEKSSP